MYELHPYSEIQEFKRSNGIEIHNRTMLIFYLGVPHPVHGGGYFGLSPVGLCLNLLPDYAFSMEKSY